MDNATQQIVNKAWKFAHVLLDDGLSYMTYTEQITDPDQKKNLREDFVHGWELLPATAPYSRADL